jgi:hypothetical protein
MCMCMYVGVCVCVCMCVYVYVYVCVKVMYVHAYKICVDIHNIATHQTPEWQPRMAEPAHSER